MGYVAEKKQLQGLLTEGVWQLLKDARAIIAGGAITSIFTNKEVNDVDVYFRSEEELFRTVAAIYERDDFTKYVELNQFEMIYNGNSQRTLMFKNKEQHVQFMTFKWFSSVQEIFETFDFTCCMGAYDCEQEDFVFHPDFLHHNSQRYLKFNPGTAYPIMSLMRVDKYRQKGYNISKTELLRVLGSCMSLKIKSWEEVKEHIGGMYGYDLNDVFNEAVDFSIEEVVNQLDDINERDIRQFDILDSAQRDFWDVVKVFCEIPETNQKEYRFDDVKYLYKCVNSEYESPMAPKNKKVKYAEGDVLDTDEIGNIYFNHSSKKLFHSSPYWVEAELLEGRVQESDYVGKTVVTGKVRINRCFEYCSDDGLFEIQYLAEKYCLDKSGEQW